MEDDDFSDHDSHYSEDFMDDIEEEQEETTQQSPDMTRQLLDFAELANADIKKFFGRRKDEKDYCDIYENNFGLIILTYILSLQSNEGPDQKSLETVFLIAICRQSGDKWQLKTLFLTFFDLLIVSRCGQ